MQKPAALSFGFLEHTADIGIWMNSTNIIDIFSMLPPTLAQVMVSGPRQAPFSEREVSLQAPSQELLLADLASEVVYLYDAEALLVAQCDIIKLEDTLLEAVFYVCPADPQNNQLELAIKAVTYHQASLKPVDDGWRAELYLDI
jgi:SHS2 domain-containing protein